MNQLAITSSARKLRSKSDLRINRELGNVPGVVYGQNITPQAIYVPEKEVHALLRDGAEAGGIIRLHLPEAGEQDVMISEVQRNPLTGKVVHIDFHKVDMNQKVKATVRIELTGEAQGTEEGGILQQLAHTVEVRCLASAIPAAIEANVSHLKLGDHLLVSDLQPPAGVEIRSDPNELVATLLAPQKELPEASDRIRDEDVQVETEEKIEAITKES